MSIKYGITKAQREALFEQCEMQRVLDSPELPCKNVVVPWQQVRTLLRIADMAEELWQQTQLKGAAATFAEVLGGRSS